ncbi:MAG: porin family protein [Hyphomicrobiales bacterium]|jgi:outer membrane immunogenic protein|nr:MAG: porin family protein [Hyphomicrobiales bacterium]
MKIAMTAIAAAVLMTGTSFAADLIVDEPVAYAPTAYDWNGFYVGVNAGYGGGLFAHPFSLDDPPDSLPGTIDVTAGGFLYGVQGGFNVQMDNILFGIEADIQGSTIDGRVSLAIDDVDDVIGGIDTVDVDAGTSLDWLATLRPRLGFVSDRFVVYATGGLAYGQTTSSINVSINDTPLFDPSITNDRFGWTVGAGIEYALADNITFKTEYLYTDLGSAEIINEDLGGGTSFTMDSTVAFHTVRAGLNFQF